MRTLVVVAEWESGTIGESTTRVINAVSQRGFPVDLLTFSCEMTSAATSIAGISKILETSGAMANPETLAVQLQAIAKKYSMIASSHRALARAALPRAAALTDSAFLSDLTGILDATTFTRGLYAGSIVAKIETLSPTVFATVRPSAFTPTAGHGGTVQVEQLAPIDSFKATRLVERNGSTVSGSDLSSAGIVLSGGRGVGSKEKMDKLALLAGKMGAALGASRAAVDAGYAPNASQVGQTGKTVAPDVYLAFGISGAIQHLAGMKDSKIIVAVNKDAEAPIFSFADYGIVGDLFDVLDDLDAKVSSKRADL